jgi:hypothetical protein
MNMLCGGLVHCLSDVRKFRPKLCSELGRILTGHAPTAMGHLFAQIAAGKRAATCGEVQVVHKTRVFSAQDAMHKLRARNRAVPAGLAAETDSKFLSGRHRVLQIGEGLHACK